MLAFREALQRDDCLLGTLPGAHQLFLAVAMASATLRQSRKIRPVSSCRGSNNSRMETAPLARWLENDLPVLRRLDEAIERPASRPTRTLGRTGAI